MFGKLFKKKQTAPTVTGKDFKPLKTENIKSIKDISLVLKMFGLTLSRGNHNYKTYDELVQRNLI